MLTTRVSNLAPEPPLNGVHNGGWRLGFGEEPGEFQKALEERFKSVNELASLGFVVKEEDGLVIDVVPGKPAHAAGVAPNMKLVAVNGRRFSPDVLRAAIAAAKGADGKIELLCENEEFFRAHAVEYRDGKRYPRLDRDDSKTDLLTAILQPTSTEPR
jgi:predicted metalloprotease with PDZ domain